MSEATKGNNAHEQRESVMAGVNLVKMERGIRGKGNKGTKVQFEGIDETAPRPDNPLEVAMNLVKGEAQEFWERFVHGFNELAYEAVADPIAEFINPAWDDDKKKNFRLSVNAMAKVLGKDKDEVAKAIAEQINAAEEVTA